MTLHQHAMFQELHHNIMQPVCYRIVPNVVCSEHCSICQCHGRCQLTPSSSALWFGKYQWQAFVLCVC